MGIVNGAVLLLAVAAVVSFVLALFKWAGLVCEEHGARALEEPRRIARVIFRCHICGRAAQETADDLAAYLDAMTRAECVHCRTTLATMEEELTA